MSVLNTSYSFNFAFFISVGTKTRVIGMFIFDELCEILRKWAVGLTMGFPLKSP